MRKWLEATGSHILAFVLGWFRRKQSHEAPKTEDNEQEGLQALLHEAKEGLRLLNGMIQACMLEYKNNAHFEQARTALTKARQLLQDANDDLSALQRI